MLNHVHDDVKVSGLCTMLPCFPFSTYPKIRSLFSSRRNRDLNISDLAHYAGTIASLALLEDDVSLSLAFPACFGCSKHPEGSSLGLSERSRTGAIRTSSDVRFRLSACALAFLACLYPGNPNRLGRALCSLLKGNLHISSDAGSAAWTFFTAIESSS